MEGREGEPFRVAVEKTKERAPRARVRIVADGKIEIRLPGAKRWELASRSRLARDFAADHPVWVSLRKHGVLRPAPSGRSRPNAERDRHLYTLRLLPKEADRLDALAEGAGLCRSALVMMLVEQAESHPIPQVREIIDKKDQSISLAVG